MSLQSVSEAIKAPGRVRVNPRTPIRTLQLQLLAIVDHFEHRRTGEVFTPAQAEKLSPAARAQLLSVGLPYETILAKVREEFPGARTTLQSIRRAASNARGGFIGYDAELPHKRPHGTKGRKYV
ncbi:hypothetical protein ACJMQP_03900 [Rhodopseudomonas palustris]